jgi:hypothetical protein
LLMLTPVLEYRIIVIRSRLAPVRNFQSTPLVYH